MKTLTRPGTVPDSEETRQKASALFTFLRELMELRSDPIRSLDQYDKVLWLHDLPREAGCDWIAWRNNPAGEENETWLEIQRPAVKPPPVPSPELAPWLHSAQVVDSSIELPELKRTTTIAVHASGEASDGQTTDGGEPVVLAVPTPQRNIEDFPRIPRMWEEYIEEWRRWAEEDRRQRRLQKVYTELFALYQSQQQLGEQYEVLLGLGFLTWRDGEGHEIKRHLITAQANLEFEAARGTITLGPAGDGARPMLEQDMIDPKHRGEPNKLAALEKRVLEVGDDVWNRKRVDSILSAWVEAVSSDATFDASFVPQEGVGQEPRVHVAPAVILRRRGQRSYLEVFAEILRQIRSGAPLPKGIERFVTVQDDEPAAGAALQARKLEDDVDGSEIYFPLESNEEQREIVHRLNTQQGVLVQGPPGTGKSHTIVNLICHLLATGQRVLVTSHAPRALEVLRSFIQEKASDIAPLSVLLLGNDRKALQAMEDSVQGITNRFNSWNAERNVKHIVELEQDLVESKKREAALLLELRDLRQAETEECTKASGNYAGTAQAVARQLHRDAACFDWLDDRPATDLEVPLSDGEGLELLELLRDAQLARLEKQVAVDPSELITPEDYAVLLKSEHDAKVGFEAADESRNHPAYETIKNLTPEQIDAIDHEVSAFLDAFDAVLQHVQPWTEDAAFQILGNQGRPWKQLLEQTHAHLEAVVEHAAWADANNVTGLEGRDRATVKGDASALCEHLERGGKLGIGPFRPEPVKRGRYLLQEVRVGGHLCDNPARLSDLVKWLNVAERFELLQRQWASFAKVSSATYVQRAAEYEDLCIPLEMALQLEPRRRTAAELVSRSLGITTFAWHERAEVEKLRRALRAVTPDVHLQRAVEQVERVEKAVKALVPKTGAPQCLIEMLEAARTCDVKRYRAGYQQFNEQNEPQLRLARRDALMDKLEAAAPMLAARMATSAGEPHWDERLGELSSAWGWAQVRGWLENLADSEKEEQLSIALDACRDRIRGLIEKLAAEKAWRHCLERMNEGERQHLVAWAKAMKNLGKGTGKYSATHRTAAQEHLEECRTAIPAWIMPVYRVAETIRPGKELFDVVIIDEASQSGPEALFLLYLAKKVVVVGDDKQISPEFVGLDRDDVNHLRGRHLSKLPHQDTYGVDNSFFDMAEIRYGGRIRLREHFRCMPEIIQFSNKLCYQSEPLVPLKQYGATRLVPVVSARYVPDGYLEDTGSKKINPPEARAIVEEIVRCCDDPLYEGKTIGVISLLGAAQAEYISKLIVERLGPERVEERQILCGDAYAFQGDERDVIFLSLVSAPMEGRRIGQLGSARDVRRFNVATSRAREQMFLFHSATASDLGQQCLRYSLLQYCQEPEIERAETANVDHNELAELAESVDRVRTPAPPPFDNWFEIDVYLRIVERGYHVVPQFEIGGYRVDLLLEGTSGRLAVECIGDRWPGNERYEQEMNSQRMLERCGCRFWRVRGSAFYMDPEQALAGLWQTLEKHGIEPMPASDESEGAAPVADEPTDVATVAAGATLETGPNHGHDVLETEPVADDEQWSRDTDPSRSMTLHSDDS